MKFANYLILIISAGLFAACSEMPTANTKTSNLHDANKARPGLTETERPQKIKDMMAARGEQDEAKPTIIVHGPKDGAVLNSSTVMVSLELSGDLKGYATGKDPATGMGNHIHVILDNQPYEAYYKLGEPFELRNVADGKHTLRVFPSRPWHESYKNDGAFQMVVGFIVKGGAADESKPVTTNTGEKVADGKAAVEGKDMAASTAGDVDGKKPLLTYSRPKGEYKGADADAIMIDFWLSNAKLTGDGGEYKVRYAIDGGEPKMIEKWQPIWLTGWTAGKHEVKLELVDKDGKPVENGGYNSTTREVTVSR